ncbi:hypothetical protein [Terriglobus aquaticus]|uniref:Uncharacterized protein n=1 Tax=Terriglobus aquaticus TaxID=940139 RepID=A0ABW9KHS8_9BACT|nr:hypothetical protein [Terriglobus aquaticus]
MKRVLSILGQSVLFFLTAIAGMLWRPFHVTHVIAQQGYTRRQYEFDWLLCDGILYLLLLLVSLLARRIRTGWISTTVAFVLTVVVIALFTKIGYKDANLLYSR